MGRVELKRTANTVVVVDLWTDETMYRWSGV
jgi:hypothetical protein